VATTYPSRYPTRSRWYLSPSNWVTILGGIWFLLTVSLLAGAFLRTGVSLPWTLALYALLTILLSVTAFVLYGWDKRCALTNTRRVPENTLHLVSLAGGWPGAQLAQQLFHHKTQKLSFRAVFWLTVVIHLALISYGLSNGWPSVIWAAWWGT
jgi:uncharacterized membrane protein YsdA (DUF1294 family)